MVVSENNLTLDDDFGFDSRFLRKDLRRESRVK